MTAVFVLVYLTGIGLVPSYLRSPEMVAVCASRRVRLDWSARALIAVSWPVFVLAAVAGFVSGLVRGRR